MLDDLTLILTSVGAATFAVALLRRRARRARATRPVPARVGARHLAEVLCTAAAEPLRIASPHWKSLAEMVQIQASERLD